MFERRSLMHVDRVACVLVLLALASCREARPVPSATPPPPDPTLELTAARRTENRLRAGVDYFDARAQSQPAMAAVAWRAAQEGLIFCERSRPRYFCQDANVARFQSVMTDRAGAANAAQGGAEVAWTIASPSQCAGVVAALGLVKSSVAPLHATLTFDDCVIKTSHTPWRVGQCSFRGPSHRGTPVQSSCPDGSTPTQAAASPPSSGEPRQPPPLMCPCFVAERPTHIEVRGRWKFDGREHGFKYTGGGVEGLTSEALVMPPEPIDISLPELVDLHLVAPLRLATGSIDVLAASEPDVLAVLCARLAGLQGQDAFEAAALARARCTGAYERDLPKVIATASPSAAAPPTVRTDSYPYRARVLVAAERAATEAHVEAGAAGWDVEVSALGFITSGSLAHRPSAPTAEALSTATMALAGDHYRYLGFIQRPRIATHGAGYAGPNVVLETPEGFLEVRSVADGAELREHLWPVTCPAADSSRLLAPLLGTPITIHTRGQPCDPVPGVECQSQPPTEREGHLGPKDVTLRPTIALTPSGRADEVEVHCVVELVVLGDIRVSKPIPRLIDVVTGAVLADSLDERRLAPRP